MKADSVRKLIQRAMSEIEDGKPFSATSTLQEAVAVLDEGTAALQQLLEQWTSTFD